MHGSTLLDVTNTITDAGILCITVTADSNSAAKAIVCLEVKMAPAVYSAITRDANGNGYLDRIDLVFSRGVSFDSLDLATKKIVGGPNAQTLVVDSTVKVAGDTTRKMFTLFLREPSNPGDHDLNNPQTGWTPDVTLSGYNSVTASSIRALDGAGPVIWKVVNKIDLSGNHSKDQVTITYSEPLERILGSRANDRPVLVFQVWRNTDGAFIKNDSMFMLLSVGEVTFISSTTITGVFKMGNNKFLDDKSWVNFKTDVGAMVPDAKQNFPAENNQKVKVEIEGARAIASSAPNPMTPNASVPNNPGQQISKNNELMYVKPELAISASQQKGVSTTIVSFSIPTLANLPDALKISGTFSVYDMAGNLVHRRSNKSIDNFPPEWQNNKDINESELKEFAVSWNGMNDKGTRAAPGAYRLILKLNLQYIEAVNPTVTQNKPINVYSVTGVSR